MSISIKPRMNTRQYSPPRGEAHVDDRAIHLVSFNRYFLNFNFGYDPCEQPIANDGSELRIIPLLLPFGFYCVIIRELRTCFSVFQTFLLRHFRNALDSAHSLERTFRG